ncbi:hypothetical protein BDK51DRAFT_51305 [Blyttiomyces helicus]|uniref:No apical meristem-associated C-terminal domain-containing protein n=1 Tax=Blyttiomyces helicus TaxID=388810 RepID=A0A4P9WMD7_9FUNG|nr:hypothetical protein BDK51DRAFT_51305 [Blyttiomyces helicus]|eukprot:RKO94074.1 hypothetical protein BDK51DRAFT_51305 [Blyttiomyces helicus]
MFSVAPVFMVEVPLRGLFDADMGPFDGSANVGIPPSSCAAHLSGVSGKLTMAGYNIENVTDSKPIACRAHKTRAAATPRKTAPAKKALHTNPLVKHTVPSTPSGKKAPVKKAPVKTEPAVITVKGKTCKKVAWTENTIINLYAARQEHLTQFTAGNVPAKGAWKLVLATWKELVEDDNDPDIMMMHSTIEVETKHLVNKWATSNKHTNAYIRSGITTRTSAAAIPEPKYFDLCMVRFLDHFPTENKVSRAGAVAQDEPVFGADKESEVEQEDHRNHTAEDEDEEGILDNEIEGDISDTATAGKSATFGAEGYWNMAATRNTTKTIAATKRKAKKVQPMPVEDAYTCDPCLKKLKLTDLDNAAGSNELVKSDWAKIASTEASAKAKVKIAEKKMQHDLELAKLHLQNER